jgi:hypothetical protein
MMWIDDSPSITIGGFIFLEKAPREQVLSAGWHEFFCSADTKTIATVCGNLYYYNFYTEDRERIQINLITMGLLPFEYLAHPEIFEFVRFTRLSKGIPPIRYRLK